MEVIFARGEAGRVSFSSLVIVGLMLRLYRYQILPTCTNYQNNQLPKYQTFATYLRCVYSTNERR